MMKRVIFSSRWLVLAVVALVASCINYEDESIGAIYEDGKVEVTLPVDRSGGVVAAATRTALGDVGDDGGHSVVWCVGDEVALWADDTSDSGATLVGEKFTMRYYGTNYTDAEFSAVIDPMDGSKSYSYRAFYPYPASVSGKVATFEIPSTQSGEYDGTADFRVSDVQEGIALSGSTLGGCELSFRSVMHAFKISVPEVANEDPKTIKGLFVTMPCDIVGTATFDMSDVSGTPQLVSGTRDNVYISFEDNLITSGDGQSVWMFFKPVSGVSGDLKIEAVCDNGNLTEPHVITLDNHTFAAGSITPIGTEIGTESAPLQELKFKVNSTQLGETVNSVTLTAPSGAQFVDTQSNVIILTPDSDGNCSASFRDDYTDNFSSGTTAIKYESDSAIVSGSITITGPMDKELLVPYLFAEDFSSVKNFNNNDNGGVTSSSTGTTAFSFTEAKHGITGWTAARAGAGAGLAVRICARYQYTTTNSWNSMSSTTKTYDARIDSPALSALKSNLDGDVKIVVKFNYKGGNQSKRASVSKDGWFDVDVGGYSNHDAGNPTFSYGYTNATGAQAYNAEIVDPDDPDGKEVKGSATISVSSNSSPDYESVSTPVTYNIESATAATRLSWKVSQNCSVSGYCNYYGNYWLYIDNIKVSIVK